MCSDWSDERAFNNNNNNNNLYTGAHFTKSDI